MSQVTNEGYQRTRLDEVLAQLDADLRAIFGPDINLDPDSIDGQTVGIIAERFDLLDQAIEDVYNGFSPSSASGAALARLVQLNGITKLAATKSTATIVVTGTNGTLVAAGFTVQSTVTGAKFVTTVDGTIAGGTATIPCEADVTGALAAPASSLTKIVTPTFGVSSVTNPSAATVGRDIETDADLRLRRRKSVAKPGQSMLDSIYANVADLDGVSQVIVLENDEDTVQPGTGLPPHSMFVCAQGGADQEIAQAIYLSKSLGVTMVGDEVEVVNDVLGNPHNIKFSRPTDVPIYVIVNVSPLVGWPTDGEQRIKDAIADWALENQHIGDDVIYSRMYEPINSVPGHSVTGLFIGTAPLPTGETDITIAYTSLASFATVNITVNVA